MNDLTIQQEPALDDFFGSLSEEVRLMLTERVTGRIASVRGLTVTAMGLPVPIGARCRIRSRRDDAVDAEVVALNGGETVLSVLGEAAGLSPGDPVECLSNLALAPVGYSLVGRVIDANGMAIDQGCPLILNRRYPLHGQPPAPLSRRPIREPLGLGVRAIDALLTAGRGQRMGIFAGTGVGKSVLMGMICRQTQADVNVIAMIGERGREVREFIENDLGPEGLARSVVIACTSDQAPALRVRAAFYAMTVAEFFRDQGADVLMMMDSLTRMAMAQRQIGLAAGEPPTAKGYPPSTFAMLPRLLERAGRTEHGSITALFTVLVEGDDLDEPLADAARGVLDGHIWLSRKLANRGHYPAIDVLNSISRVADSVVAPQQCAAATQVRRVLATWDDIEDLVGIGAYVPGANAGYDVAVQTREEVNAFLQQSRESGSATDETRRQLLELGRLIAERREQAAANAARSAAGGNR
jgi:flagellum-specific ATP synthase